MPDKQDLIEIFRKNVKGKSPCVDGMNVRHDGRKGHWLEQQFGIHHNADNFADIYGYELKNETTSKTTFGDWSANEYIFKNSTYSSIFYYKKTIENRDLFLSIFGKPNTEKNGRFSWSGEPCPKILEYNKFGQRLVISENQDIIAEYSYSKDQRPDKATIVPEILHQEHLQLARWYGNSTPANKKGKCLKLKVENKFNDKGWFTCKTDSLGHYCQICFGEPMTFDKWIKLVSNGIVFFDSGMYQGNKRPYSQWRANNSYWDSLITEKFD